ncbi:MAG: hypothetical protein ABID84_04485 [Chloroflexota bacterium]
MIAAYLQHDCNGSVTPTKHLGYKIVDNLVDKGNLMDTGNTAWLLTSSALVMLMTPGLAFFYGGLVRAKNVVSTIMYSFIAVAVVSVVWVLWGYSLAFGDGGRFIGDFEFIGLSGIDINDGDGIPDLLFVVFQMMFAIITPALITGAIVERFKFTTYLVFLVLWGDPGVRSRGPLGLE